MASVEGRIIGVVSWGGGISDMQNTLVILSCALLFVAARISQAQPLDSPDIVYIDGQPCNSACQSYMAWSRQIMPVPKGPLPVPPGADQVTPKASGRRAKKIRDVESKPSALGCTQEVSRLARNNRDRQELIAMCREGDNTLH
jgi:hypothetical protein